MSITYIAKPDLQQQLEWLDGGTSSLLLDGAATIGSTTKLSNREPVMTTGFTAATLPGVEHHRADVNGAHLHYVSAGTTGFPILLVHAFLRRGGHSTS